jgi:bla regulator protein blaR1
MSASGLLGIVVSLLGWCLLHFVWQAAIVGTVYALLRGLLPRGNPRYLAALLAMFVMAVCPLVTGWHELSIGLAPVGLADLVVNTTPIAAASASAASASWQSLLDAALPWLVLTWAVGVAILGMRVCRQWLGLRAMLRAAEKLPDWQARARHFADRLGLRRMVPVLASVRVATPTLVGWLRPAVVLPLAVLARMPAAQIDLVLAHELAHLKRFDHIANLFQVVLETLFFYHPVVHWISRDVRNERELCCDALALCVTGGERRDFVAALASLEAFRDAHADLVLAANGGVLVERAWFIAGVTPSRNGARARGHTAWLLLLAAALGVAVMWRADVARQRRDAAIAAAGDASVLQRLATSAVDMPTMNLADIALPRVQLRMASPAAMPAGAHAQTMPIAPLDAVSLGKPVVRATDLRMRLAPIAVLPRPLSNAPSAPMPEFATPKLVSSVRPVYPQNALQAGLQGRVVIEFTLDTAGVPRDLDVVQTGGAQFDAAALRALADWRFAPPATPGARRYRQAFAFLLGSRASQGADDATVHGCLVMTGSHICRQAFDPVPGVQVLRPNH